MKAIKSELTERENDSSNPIFSDKLEDLLPELDKDLPSDELKIAIAFLAGKENDAAAWTQYAHALLAGNEFQFID